MARTSAGRRWSGGLGLFIWTAGVVIDMGGVQLVAGESGSGSLIFGAVGTSILIPAISLFAIVAAVNAKRGVSGRRALVLAYGQFAGAGIVLAMLIGFFLGGAQVGLTVTPLLLFSAVAEAAIGAGVLESARLSARPAEGR